MVQLRVDVDAARARQEFNATSRTVDNFADQLGQAGREAARLDGELTAATARVAQAQREFDAASRAADDAADQVRQLRTQVDALGSAAPAALVRQLREAENRLRAAEREEQRMLDTLARTTHEANQLDRAFNDAGDRVQHITRQLAEARREADRLRLAMDRANRAASNPLRGAQRGLLGFRRQIDQVLSQSPMTSLSNAIGSAWASLPVELKGTLVASGLAMAAIVAEAAGAAINGLVLAAVGAGLLAGIVAIAAKTNNVVQSAFKNTFQPIGDEVVRFAQMAEGPLVHTAQIFSEAWKAASDDVRGAFADILGSGALEALAKGIGGFITEAMPGFREAIRAAGPILKELANDLPLLGSAVSDFFSSLASGAGGAIKGVRALIYLIGGSLIVIGNVIEVLSQKFDSATKFLEVIFTGLSKIPVLGKAFEPVANFFRDFNTFGDGAARSLDDVGASADSSALAMGRQADATSRASRAAADLSKKMSDLVSTELGAKEASIQFEAALDAITASAKENGKSLDITGEKGRANAETILAGVRAAEAKREADIALAGGENASAEAVAAANAKYAAQVEQIRAAATAAGFNKAQVDLLIGSLNRVPANVKTTVTTEYRTIGDIPRDQRVGAGNIKGYASGTNSAPPGWAWTGENGPELVKFKGGEQVLNQMRSAQIAGARTASAANRGNAGSGPVQVQLVTGGSRGGGLDGVFSKWLDDSLFSGRVRLQVVNGRVRPV